MIGISFGRAGMSGYQTPYTAGKVSGMSFRDMYTKMLYIPLEAEKTGRNCTLIMMKVQRKITL